MVRLSKKAFIVWLGVLTVTLCPADVTGPYMGQEPPGMMPKVFAPGFVSLSDRCEVAGFFSADMNEFYFTETDGRWTWTRILSTKCENGVWR
jgi:hypothetical protein